jgi:hypothetical protein
VTLRARDRFGPEFPCWLVCPWRDTSLKAGARAVRPAEMSRIFSSIDFFAYEGEGELTMARRFGWNGPALPINSLTQFDFDRLASKAPLPPSKRRTIVIDCSRDRPESAAAVLGALNSCAEILQNFMTVVCSPSRAAMEAVMRVHRGGLFPLMCESQLSSRCVPELLGSSRIYFGAPYLSDDPDFSLIYAAAMGAFPIEICNSSESNWADPDLDGLSVAPADTDGLKSVVARVLTDDGLVDKAAKKNLAIAQRKFSVTSADVINDQRRDLFEEIFVGPRALR